MINQINVTEQLYIETPSNKELASKLMLLEYEIEDQYLRRYYYQEYKKI